MPQIQLQERVLNGRGRVLLYGSGTSAGKWYYKEKVEGQRRYKEKQLFGASSLEQAIAMAPEAAIELAKEPEKKPSYRYASDPLTLIQREEKRERPKIDLEVAMDQWLSEQEKRVDAGAFQPASYSHKFNCCRHIKLYLKKKKVTFTTQINPTTFDDYPVYRLKQTDKRIVIHRELAVLGEFIKSYLVKHKYIPAHLWLDGQFLPRVKVRDTDRDANPAINPEDWRTIIDYIREEWRPLAYEKDQFGRRSEKSIYFRNMFWHWLLIAKSTGMSPEEICKMKWKSVEIIDVGRISKSKAIEEYEQILDEIREEGKEGEIYIEPPNLDINPSDWVLNHDAWGREERLISFITTVRAKTSRVREIPCNLGYVFRRWKYFLENELKHKVRGDDYVFAQIHNEMKQPNQRKIQQHWRWAVDKLMDEGKLKGHKFSDRPYTLYSLRSTFIENHLMKGTDIFLLARICGNSVKTIMDTYERIDIRKRTKEITDIEYGKKTSNAAVVQLYAD
ncbi:hypothetical protein [Prochlorococcus marinus]|uniref:Tyr recombinase domain-containing protein n=1 Tax=Prochlorococcus marinus (strain MIT 9211) TaxID=93059 RepID=A9BCA0_PROM4|nr:hypothetical protein [Prochlorococcus marinus]ABX09462.1 Hypothetical protein P9211_15311 [Prochlorococcus marinus str. MIT 9211]